MKQKRAAVPHKTKKKREMKTKLQDDDEFFVVLEDGETYGGVDGCIVVRGDWSSVFDVFSEDKVPRSPKFRKRIKEVLYLSSENLLKIRETMPELWLEYKAAWAETD